MGSVDERKGVAVLSVAALLVACRAEDGGGAMPPRTATATASEVPATGVAAASATSASPSAEPAPSAAPECPAGEVFIPATGPEGFMMGSGNFGNDPRHRVVLTKPFCFDATEVTVAAYKTCVDAGNCKPPRTWGMWINFPTKSDHPVNKLGWRLARNYCKAQGKDLPTEAQWEWAATGGDERPWPWGSEPATCEHADFTPAVLEGPSSDDGCRGGGTSPVGSTPRGDRVWPSGALHDLAGNVWEWTLDNYAATGKKPGPLTETDPLHLRDEASPHVTRGGGWNRSAKGIRAQFRAGSPVDYQVPALGFRCLRALAAGSRNDARPPSPSR